MACSTFRCSNVAEQMRVLQVSAFFDAHGGGIEVVAGQLARRSAQAGMYVCWMAGGPPEELPFASDRGLVLRHAKGIDVLERTFGLPLPLWTPKAIAALWREIRAARVVHIHDYLYVANLLSLVFAKLQKRPVLITQHIGLIPFRSRVAAGLLDFLNRSLGRWALRNADRVVFVSKTVRDYFESFMSFPQTAEVLPNGVDRSRFFPTEHVPPQGRVRCLFVGRFVEKKGLALLRRCMDIDGLRWTFVGWGPLSPEEWGAVPAPLELVGKATPDEVARLYRAADVLVLPSIGEGFPLVVQEALASGTPVLVSHEVADAFPTIDSRCVFAVDLHGPEGIENLRRVLSTLPKRREELAAAREHAVALARQWSWETCASRYGDLYAELASKTADGVASSSIAR
jgi:glycosyltransferase involved in cell wall biosynthesis